MRHDPDRISTLMHQTANLITNNPDTPRLLAEWAGHTTSGGGPGQINATRDPTGNAATSIDHYGQLLARWTTATLGMTPHGLAHWINGWAARTARMDQPTLRRWWWRCNEIQHVIWECAPMDREHAEELLRQEAHLAARAKDCKACESPAETIKAGLCVPCYNMRAQAIHRGRADYADDNWFTDLVRNSVRRGEISRPASPLWLLDAPKYEHEGDVA